MANDVIINVKLQDLASNELKKLQGNFSSMQKSVITLGSAFVGLRAITGILKDISNSAMGFVNVSAEFERLGVALKTVTGNSYEAEKALEWIKEFTATTPFQLQEVGDAFTRLRALGIEDIPKQLKLIGDLSSAFGKDLSTGLDAFTGVLANRTVMLKQFGVLVENQGNQMTFQWTKNGTQMSKTINKTRDEIIKVMHEIGSNFEGSMNNLMQTYIGRLSNMKDNWNLLLNEIGQTGDVLNEVKAIVSTLNELFIKLRTSADFKESIKSMGSILGQFFRGVLHSMKLVNDSFMFLRQTISGWQSINLRIRGFFNEGELDSSRQRLLEIQKLLFEIEKSRQSGYLKSSDAEIKSRDLLKEQSELQKQITEYESLQNDLLLLQENNYNEIVKQSLDHENINKVITDLLDIHIDKQNEIKKQIKETTKEIEKQSKEVGKVALMKGLGDWLVEYQNNVKKLPEIVSLFNKELAILYKQEEKNYKDYTDAKKAIAKSSQEWTEAQYKKQIEIREIFNEKLSDMYDKELKRFEEQERTKRLIEKETLKGIKQNIIEDAFGKSDEIFKDLFFNFGKLGESLGIVKLETMESFSTMKNFAKDTAQSMNQFFSNFFFDALKGQFDNLSDYFDSFLDSMLRSISNALAQNVTESLIGDLLGNIGVSSSSSGTKSTSYVQSSTGVKATVSAPKTSAMMANKTVPAPVTVNVQNNSSSKVSVQDISFNMNEQIIDVVVEDMSNGGRLSRLIRG